MINPVSNVVATTQLSSIDPIFLTDSEIGWRLFNSIGKAEFWHFLAQLTPEQFMAGYEEMSPAYQSLIDTEIRTKVSGYSSLNGADDITGILKQIPLVEAPQATSTVYLFPINVSSFNVRYDTGFDTHATINTLTEQGLDGAAPSDIVLLQEVTWQTTGNIIHQTQDTHTTFLGEGYDGGTNGEFSPVLYNHERFDAVYTEHLPLHNKGDFDAGNSRVANFVLLKDKLTGGTVLVVNCHLDNGSVEARDFAKQKIQNEIDSIKAEFPVDTVMWGGDMNGPKGVIGYEEPSADNTPTGNGHRSLDHLYLDSASDSMWAGSYAIQDGGVSDHDVYTGTLVASTDASSKNNRAGLTNQNNGVLLYGDRVSTDKNKNYEGDFWLVGYGAPDVSAQNLPRFSDVSGMYVSEGASVTVNHNDDVTDNNKTEEYQGFVPWVGEEHNDQFSLVQINDDPSVDVTDRLIGSFTNRGQ